MSEVVEDVGAPPPVAEPAPQEPPPPPVDPDEADAVELPAGKHVPLAALKAQRDENRTLKAQLAQAQPTLAWAQQNKPVMDFINQNPQLLQPRPMQAEPPAGADPQLIELARALDYFKADGTPDLDRAAKFNSIIDTRAEQKARAMVEPVAGTLIHQQSERNWQQAVAEKLPGGQAIDAALLADAWRAVASYPNGAHILSDPRAVKVIVNTVKMQQLEKGGQLPSMPAAPSGRPVVTEPQGSQPRGPRTVMNDTERAIIGTRMDEKKYNEYTKDFKPGRPNVLEDN